MTFVLQLSALESATLGSLLETLHGSIACIIRLKLLLAKTSNLLKKGVPLSRALIRYVSTV